jgi:hypothetical protein
MSTLIFCGYDIDERLEGDFVVSQNGKVVATVPTLDLAQAWVKEQDARAVYQAFQDIFDAHDCGSWLIVALCVKLIADHLPLIHGDIDVLLAELQGAIDTPGEARQHA